MQEATLTCPHCQHAGRHELLPFLDLNKHPKQKLAILTDSLFTVNCPSCAKQFTVLHELLVVDEKQHIGLLLAPQSEVRASELQSHHDLVCRLLLEKIHIAFSIKLCW